MPTTRASMFMIGEVLYQRGLSVEAREPLERASHSDPSWPMRTTCWPSCTATSASDERAQRAAARAAS
jgi:hypothetical protein